MKLIVTGATGFVGREIVRQSLARPEITSVVALARSPVSVSEKQQQVVVAPPGSDVSSKLRSVVVDDYGAGAYTDAVRKEMAGAGACIWYDRGDNADQIENARFRICQARLPDVHARRPTSPFRFLYMSGAAAERDATKTPKFMPEYSLMRGETENQVLALAKELNSEAKDTSSHVVEVGVAKPGYVTAPGAMSSMAMGAAVRLIPGFPSISVVDLTAAMLDQVISGFEKDTLLPEDLIRIAQGVPPNTA
ncbi:NAD(P)-binding protein [Xylariaceae sp. FL0594]|nr:NAD(P)-binding protein [Xylariaceae sp. FL0594]